MKPLFGIICFVLLWQTSQSARFVLTFKTADQFLAGYNGAARVCLYCYKEEGGDQTSITCENLSKIRAPRAEEFRTAINATCNGDVFSLTIRTNQDNCDRQDRWVLEHASVQNLNTGKTFSKEVEFQTVPSSCGSEEALNLRDFYAEVAPLPCELPTGQIVYSGNQIELGCLANCVCENGNLACNSLCPPSHGSEGCRSIHVPGNCCAEHVCDNGTISACVPFENDCDVLHVYYGEVDNSNFRIAPWQIGLNGATPCEGIIFGKNHLLFLASCVPETLSSVPLRQRRYNVSKITYSRTQGENLAIVELDAISLDFDKFVQPANLPPNAESCRALTEESCSMYLNPCIRSTGIQDVARIVSNPDAATFCLKSEEEALRSRCCSQFSWVFCANQRQSCNQVKGRGIVSKLQRKFEFHEVREEYVVGLMDGRSCAGVQNSINAISLCPFISWINGVVEQPDEALNSL